MSCARCAGLSRCPCGVGEGPAPAHRPSPDSGTTPPPTDRVPSDGRPSTPARPLDTTGLVAPAPLAMACLAHDAGMPIDVESEYLPHHLLRGTWVGEFPT
ncbi:Imm49 family immunity protein [Streptomyces sp. NRRL B-24484]|uniref:Imm49 family immunity protein n=1 Tax=Streptomyces sp. NRRL B-24484 TaxID=1463833 RepID=UPI000995EF9F